MKLGPLILRPTATGLLCFALFRTLAYPCEVNQKHLEQRPTRQFLAFAALRPPDTIDRHGPYRVTVQQISRIDIASGSVVYRVRSAKAGTVSRGTVPIHRMGRGRNWVGYIPGQPRGTIIRYYFLLLSRGGGILRHPRAPGSYRFRVLESQIISVQLPTRDDDWEVTQHAELLLQSTSRPEGKLFVRILSPFRNVKELRIVLSPGAGPVTSQDYDTYKLKAQFPRLDPGEIAELYFEVRTREGAELRAPPDAPARVYSIKRPTRALQALNSKDTFVLDVRARGRERWIALKGGGVWYCKSDHCLKHFAVGQGLPSGIARFVLPDPVSRGVYIGTDKGIVSIEPDGNSTASIAVPYHSSWSEEPQGLSRLGTYRRAGPAAVSSLDGTLIFQLQGKQVVEQSYPVALFFQLRDGNLDQWQLPTSMPPVVGLSSSLFDTVDGCWLFGGFVEDGAALSPILLERCGESVNQVRLRDFVAGEFRARPERIVALARDPSTGDILVALEFRILRDPQPQSGYGVYRVSQTSGELRPLAPELASLGVEITSLATDWTRGAILVGTFGKGLLVVSSQRPVSYSRLLTDIPEQITALEVSDQTGSILVGTSLGAYEILIEENRLLQIGPPTRGTVAIDSLPMDVNQNSGRVLVSSYSAGPRELGHTEATGRWVPLDRLPIVTIPDGRYGDAQYSPAGDPVVIVYSKGLLQFENGRTRLIGSTEGIDTIRLLRLLVRRSGEIWMAYSPMPFGHERAAAVQVLRDGKFAQTIQLLDEDDIGPIGRWLEVPERNSVFAATGSGTLEIQANGSVTALSTNPVSSIARDPCSHVIGVAGGAVERWDGQKFSPFLFRLEHPRWPRGGFFAGNPIDLAFDASGNWYLLFNNGRLAILKPDGSFFGILDAEDGIPSTARRLLGHPTTGDIFIGSDEGMVVIRSESSSSPTKKG